MYSFVITVFQQHLTWIQVFHAVEAQAKFSCKVHERISLHLWDFPWNVVLYFQGRMNTAREQRSLETQRNSEVKEVISCKIPISVI